jgi:hypothetical protein
VHGFIAFEHREQQTRDLLRVDIRGDVAVALGFCHRVGQMQVPKHQSSFHALCDSGVGGGQLGGTSGHQRSAPLGVANCGSDCLADMGDDPIVWRLAGLSKLVVVSVLYCCAIGVERSQIQAVLVAEDPVQAAATQTGCAQTSSTEIAAYSRDKKISTAAASTAASSNGPRPKHIPQRAFAPGPRR